MEQPNLNNINQISGEDLDFKTKMITILKRELSEEIESYKNKLDSRDFKSTAEMVHKLKHKISLLGLEKSYDIANQYEDNLCNNMTQLQVDFEEILKSMQEFVKGI